MIITNRYHRRDRDAKNAEKKNLELQNELGDIQAKLHDAENNRKYSESEAAVSYVVFNKVLYVTLQFDGNTFGPCNNSESINAGCET